MARQKRVPDGGRSRRLPNEKLRSREHLLTSEVDALLEAAKEQSRYRDRDYALILMMFRHGLRAVEAAMLEWKDIDLSRNSIYIRRVKGSQSGVHPLEHDERDALLKIQQSEVAQIFVNERKRSFLIPSKVPGRADQATGISRVVERVGEAADLGIKVHAHMLRHSCGYWLANQGYDTRLIQDYLGHKNIQHTVRYTKLNPDRFREIRWSIQL
ncbi:MAG: tyrosine-type recombinase/integrase [Phormidesmis sp. CAN_BIN44]|nr:tyrosine-type recombinase/integrase [Phormidesmis sp. CAN_BIN44]